MIRIIPRLDVKGPNVVKGVNLEGLRVLGRPELFAPYYYAEGADELFYLDTVASLYGRNNLSAIVGRAAEKIFVPLTVGGGIRSVEDIRAALRAGADRVSINTAAIANPNLIAEGADNFGAQCIVISIEARRLSSGRYECLTDSGRESTGKDAIAWAEEAVRLGAGEIIVTSVDNEGTGRGFDLELTQLVADRVNVPVIASGGAGCAEHVRDAVLIGKANGVCLASILHYECLEVMADADYEEEGNTDFLKKKNYAAGLAARNRRGIQSQGIALLKTRLADWGIQVRRSEQNTE